MSTLKQFCTFYVNTHYFGVDVLQVQEVILNQSITPVPLADNVIEGLINLRGDIVTAINLRKRLNGEQKSSSDEMKVVVVFTSEGAVSLLVDEIGDVIEVSSDELEPVPDNLENGNAKLITGVYKLENTLLHILDIEAATNIGLATVA